MTLGVYACAAADAVAQVRQAVDLGVTRFLLLPPFYFKGVEDAGLYDWHAQVFAAVDPAARFILYHIPQVTQVPLSADLILRLAAAFPDRVVAVKDSAGIWDDTRVLIDSGRVPVLVGDERLLHRAAALGAAGSICGMANLHPERMIAIFETRAEDPALTSEVSVIVSHPVIPALKAAMVARTGNPDWAHLRAPLTPVAEAARAAIVAAGQAGASAA